MKNKRKSYGNKRRLIFFSIGALIYIAVVFIVYNVTFANTRSNLIDAYRKQQMREIYNTEAIIGRIYKYEGTMDSVVDYISDLSYSGERFYILTVDGEVVFCRDKATSSRLGELKNPEKLYESISTDNTYIDTERFTVGGHNVNLSIFVTEDLILNVVSFEETRYSSFILLAVLAMALLATLEITVGNWNRMVKKHAIAEDELLVRNEHIEAMSEALTNNVTDRNASNVILDADGIADVGEEEYYNVYTMRRLLEKSDDARLAPVHLITVQVDMSDGYIAREIIFRNMNRIKRELKGYEVMGELRKGLFIIYVYRVSKEKAVAEYNRIAAICNNMRVNKRFGAVATLIDDPTRTNLEVFDELVAPVSSDVNGGRV